MSVWILNTMCTGWNLDSCVKDMLKKSGNKSTQNLSGSSDVNLRGGNPNLIFGYIFLKTAWKWRKLGGEGAVRNLSYVDTSLNSSVYFVGSFEVYIQLNNRPKRRRLLLLTLRKCQIFRRLIMSENCFKLIIKCILATSGKVKVQTV